MYLDKRSTAILLLLVNRNDYVSIHELVKTFHISRRTIYYDLEKINDWLIEHDIEPVQYIRSQGYYLTEKAKKIISQKLPNLEDWEYEYTPEERLGWLAIHLFISDKPLFIDDLSEKTRVSRNTTIDDLKKLKDELQDFSLSLNFNRQKGYYIQGNENDKRKAIVYYISQIIPANQEWSTFLTSIQHLFKEKNEGQELFFEELQKIIAILNECEKELGIQFADEALYNLALRFWLFGKRVVHGNVVTIDPVEKEVIRETKEYKAAEKISKKLKKIFSVPFSDDEIYYVATHLLSAKIQYSANVRDCEAVESLKVVAQKMVTDFQSMACVSFSNRKEVENNLLLHLKPTYYRIKYGIKMENPLVAQIKKEYNDIFLITKKVIHHLETLIGKKVPDDETALIAIHFGGWLRKEGLKLVDRKKAIIVCPNGIGTSTILKHQLEGLFSSVDFVETLSVREYEKRDLQDIDFTISTVPLNREGHPIIQVNPILTDIDKERLLKKVHSLTDEPTKQTKYSAETIVEIIKQYATIEDEKRLVAAIKEYLYKPEFLHSMNKKPSLIELLHPSFIQIDDEVKDWETAIRIAAKPLLDNGYIRSTYIQKMIDYVKKYGPYIIVVPNVALPHGKPEDGAIKIGMSLLVLKKPVSFTKEKKHQVKLLFVLSSIDQETHLRALSQLSEVLSSASIFEKITKCNDAYQIWKIFKDKTMKKHQEKGDS